MCLTGHLPLGPAKPCSASPPHSVNICVCVYVWYEYGCIHFYVYTFVLNKYFLFCFLAVAVETVTTCLVETVQRLSCETGVISVQEALYGRTDSKTCTEGKPPEQLANTNCIQGGTVDVIKKRCDGKKVCEISVNVFGTPDPCPGTFKYLQTKYSCLPAIHQVTCEHSFMQLHCDQGQVITLYGADYGRRDQTTCIYKRPATQIGNIDCSNPTSVVSSRCDGKNSCLIEASNSVFGDPCVGTVKYLEVAYICEYPSTNTEESSHQSHQPGSSETMLHFRLCTTLLLAATWSLTVVCTERAITCGNSRNVHRLSCDTGVISVQTAVYGRSDNETCSEGRPQRQLANTECAQDGTVDVVKRRCDGKRQCELNLNVVSTPNPCPGISKYLETSYICFPAIRLVACEGSLAHLQCAKGQVIFVYGADYGRRDQTTCAFRRPPSQLDDVLCLRPTTKVAESCNGKNSCTIRASNSVFGDPCVGTYKYLEVAYICEYPGLTPLLQKLTGH
ncbi:L-rhamnose-binding lectin CSL1-like [Centropristis striata]|uniref:L-rhamnose-binding lectin CSL1-like n=1 Tax=Centropristis striata TaxID=184440 RepID=UPI0027E16F54|nr:L-rhamnose-binding lectin CSL1-like [Centropristis striata]